MEFRILGPVEAVADGEAVELGGGKLRTLLGLLLLEANHVVSAERLIDALWDASPPGTATNILQVYVSQLRRALREAEVGSERRLVTRRPGYMLRVDADGLDLARFERGVAEGRAALAAGNPEAGAASLREALALWRGEPFEGAGVGSVALADIERLAEERLAAVADRVEADLQLGRHDAVIGELESLVAANPLHERLAGRLMLALYRAGRQADALEVYRRTREVLVEELGIEPGPALHALERAILIQDTALAAPASPTAAAAPPDEGPGPEREVRKTVTALAVAPGTGSLDPEAARRVAARVLAEVEAVVARYGGTVTQAGEAPLALFGIPAVHEDDALRALRSAVELRGRLGALGDELARDLGVRLDAGLGVASGDALVRQTELGGSLVAGDTAARAAQLATAGGGEIFADDATRRAVAGAAELKPADGGRRRKSDAPAWRVVAVSQEVVAPGRRSDGVVLGRARELAQLRQAYERAVGESSAYLFTVLGPAGIGKSTLLREFVAGLAGEARVLSGRCVPYGDGITFWPLAEILRQAVAEAGGETIRALLGDEPDADAIAERLAGAVGAGEPKAGSDATFWAVRKLFERLAAERPLVLVFDDVHWAEPMFLDLLEHVADWSRAAPILLVCLARPELLEERSAWAGGKTNATTILLGGLSETDSGRLVELRVPSEVLGGGARERILDVAEGNPLFIEQLGAMLAEVGEAALEGPLPQTIQAVLAARLDRLSPALREAIDRAAVIGRDFVPSAVVELHPEAARPDVPGALRALVGKLLLQPGRAIFAGEETYRFQHQLVRDVAYESLPKALRAELHEGFAGWLERTVEGRDAEYQEVLGYHLEQAFLYRAELGLEGRDELGARAGALLFAAGRRAATRGDMPAAIGLHSRAAAVTPAGDPSRADLLTELAEALREGGDFSRADRVLAEALALAASRADRAVEAQARIALLRVQLATNREPASGEVEDIVAAVIDVLTELGDERRLAKAWFLRAWLEWLGCRAMAAAESSRRAAAHAERAGDERGQAQALHLLVGADLFGPTPIPAARARCEEVMRTLPGQRRVEASATRALAGLTAMEGRFAEALVLLERDREILEDMGLKVAAAGATEIAGLVHMLAGEPVAAERELRRGYEAFERMGELSNLSTLAAMLAQALYAQGRDEEALRLTETSESSAAEEDLHTQVQWRAARAKVLARAGQLDEAVVLASEAVGLGGRTDFLVMRGNAALDLAEVLLLAGRADDSVAAAQDAVALYERKGASAAVAAARRLLPPRGRRASRV
jgi:predicted ATPase/DNA-binding SARP family transcriptional activator